MLSTTRLRSWTIVLVRERTRGFPGQAQHTDRLDNTRGDLRDGGGLPRERFARCCFSINRLCRGALLVRVGLVELHHIDT